MSETGDGGEGYELYRKSIFFPITSNFSGASNASECLISSEMQYNAQQNESCNDFTLHWVILMPVALCQD